MPEKRFTINIKPKFSENNNRNLSSSYGSFNTYKNSLTGGFSKNSLNATVNYANLTSEGYRKNSKYQRNSLLFNSNYHKGKHHLSANILFADLLAQIPSSLKYDDYLNSPEIAAPNWASVKGVEDYSKRLAGLSYNLYLNQTVQNRLTLFGGISSQYESRPFDILSDRINHIGFRNIFTFTRVNCRLIAGTELYTEQYHYSLYQTNAGKKGELKNKNSEKRQYANFFAYYYYKPTKKIILDVGLNMNVLKFNISDRFDSDNNNITGQFSYNPILSPRVGVNYQLTQSVIMYGSVGHGFSHPSLEETLMPEGSLNPDLKPEQGIQFELGSRLKLLNGKTVADITLYRTELNNLLVTKRETEDIFYGINAGKTLHRGLELNVRQVIIGNNFFELLYRLNGNFSENIFLDFIDDGDDFSGNYLPGIPNYTIKQSLIIGFEDYLMANIELFSVGSQYLTDYNLNTANEYYTLNAGINYNIYSGKLAKFFIFASANNILNRKYAGMILANAPTFNGSAPRYYYPSEPANFNIGINIKL